MPRRVGKPTLTDENERLMVRLAALGCASSSALRASSGHRSSERAMRMRLRRLEQRGLVERVSLSAARAGYTVTQAGRRASPTLMAMLRAGRERPTDAQLLPTWWRAELWRLFIADGWTVGSDPASLLIVRRYLLDRMRRHPEVARDRLIARGLRSMESSPALLPPSTFKCPHCGAESSTPPCRSCGAQRLVPSPLESVPRCSSCSYRGDGPHNVHKTSPFARGRQVVLDEKCQGQAVPSPDYTPYLIASRRDAKGNLARLCLILVDNPYVSVKRQLDQLPLYFSYAQPELEVLFWPSDDSHDLELGREFPPSARTQNFRRLLRPGDGFNVGRTTKPSSLKPLLLPAALSRVRPGSEPRSTRVAHRLAKTLARSPVLPATPPRLRRASALVELGDALHSRIATLTQKNPAWSVAQAASYLLAT